MRTGRIGFRIEICLKSALIGTPCICTCLRFGIMDYRDSFSGLAFSLVPDHWSVAQTTHINHR